MLADLRALLFLESRQFVNRMRETARNPSRVLLYIVAVGYFGAIAFARSSGHHALKMSVIHEPYASIVLFTYLALLGILAYGAASGILGAFSSAADAHFLTGSLISERVVVVWLQLRRCAGSLGRMLFTILLYALIFSAAGTVSGISLATMGGTLLASALAVPVLRMRVTAGAQTAQTAAAAVAAAGIVPMLILFAAIVAPSGTSRAIENIGAGRAFNELFNANPLALGALYACGALLIAAAYVLGENLYPDLYAASLKALEYRSGGRPASSAALAPEYVYEIKALPQHNRALDAMRGPFAITWKEWVGFTRSSSMQRTFLFGAAACLLCGGIFGTVASRSGNPLGDSLTLASIASNMITIFIAMGSAIALAGDLRKPLWWIGRDPLFTRLIAWIAGTSWRMTFCICAGVVGWSAAMRLPVVALAGLPLAVIAVVHLRAVGLVLYSLFPSTIDQRGPLAMVRVVLTYLLAAPPAIAGVVVGVVFRTLPGGVALAVTCSVLEAAALIRFAAARIERHGIAIARDEES